MPNFNTTPQNLSPLSKKSSWVFQKRKINGRACRVKIKRAWPVNPQTEVQMLNRQKFAVATLRWQLLDEKEKARWRTGPFYAYYWGYRNFVRDFMLAE